MNVDNPRRRGDPVPLRSPFNVVILPIADVHRIGDFHQIASPDLPSLRGTPVSSRRPDTLPRKERIEIPTPALGRWIVHRAMSDEVSLQPRDLPGIVPGASAHVGAIHRQIESDPQGVDLPLKVVMSIAIRIQEKLEDIIDKQVTVVLVLSHPEVILGNLGVQRETALCPPQTGSQLGGATAMLRPQDIHKLGEPGSVPPFWGVRSQAQVWIAGEPKANDLGGKGSHQVQVTRGKRG